MKKSTLAITLGAIAVAAAALVPYKVEKEEPEEGSKTTKVKLRALSYALDISVTPDEGVDVNFKAPGISKVSLVSVEKHIDLKKDDDVNFEDCDFDCDNCKNPCDEYLPEDEIPECDMDCDNCETPCVEGEPAETPAE